MKLIKTELIVKVMEDRRLVIVFLLNSNKCLCLYIDIEKMSWYNKHQGSGMMYANVIIEYGNKSVDKEFTYIIPNKYLDKIKIWHRVIVPFNNKLIEGFVLNISNNYDGKYELKEINDICD